MNKNPNNVMLTAYITFPVSDFEKLKRLFIDNDISVELVTSKDFFDSMMFKQQSPQA